MVRWAAAIINRLWMEPERPGAPLGPRLGAATRESIARWALSDPVGECAETKEAT